MSNDFEVGVDVAVAPDAAWTLAGDPVRIIEWFDPVVEVMVAGDERTATLGNGAVLVERIVERDDSARSYAYEVVSGIPGITSHRATIRVTEAPGGSRVWWRQTATSDVEGYDIEARLAQVMLAGLGNLRAMLEASPDD